MTYLVKLYRCQVYLVYTGTILWSRSIPVQDLVPHYLLEYVSTRARSSSMVRLPVRLLHSRTEVVGHLLEAPLEVIEMGVNYHLC